MKKILKLTLIICVSFLFTINIYVNMQNFIGVTALIENQSIVVGLQSYFNEINAERNRLLEEKIITIASKEVKGSKPTFEYLKSVTVRVLNIMDVKTGRGSIGTGTIVKVTDDYTYILTNRHVAPIGSTLIYVEKNAKKYKAEVLKNGFSRDLSLIRINGRIPHTSVIKGLKEAKEQDKVYSVGMYMGMYNMYTEGTVSGWNDNNSQVMNMPCLFGCSGSGIFNSDGELVAVLYAGTAYSMFGFDTAKAICVPYIGVYAFLEEIL